MEKKGKKISRRNFLKKGLLTGGLAAAGFPMFSSRLLHAAPKPKEKVKEVYFACVEPFTGAAAGWHKAGEFSLQIFMEELASKGGIKSLGGAVLKELVFDTESSPEVTLNVAERACNDPRVCAIVGCAQSASCLILTRVAEKYGVPVLMPEPISPRLTSRGFKYSFMMMANTNVTIQDTLEGIAWLKDKTTGKKVEKMAVVYEDSEYGRAMVEGIKFYSPQYGLKIEYFPYSGLKDFDPFMMKVKEGNADFLYLVTFPTHQLLIVQAAKRIGYNPLGMEMGSIDDRTIATLGKDADYLFDFAWESHEAKGLSSWEKERFRRINAKQSKLSGIKNDRVLSSNWNALAVIVDSLERCGKQLKDPTRWTRDDRRILRDAIASVNLTPEKGGLYPWPIVFKSTGENATARVTFTQIQQGKELCVYPEDSKLKEAEVIFPVPPWDKR
ncbi:MAG: ABC transporter substrate-binding protein [Candidatus Helarchaeota archaeon]|nr:ABC transporter substrate-binding protein [Candidatus Helarchaeota archaeon]